MFSLAVWKQSSSECSRTFGFYRVNFEVNNLKSFACLAFPHTTYLKTPRKHPIFGDELVTSFPFLRRKEIISESRTTPFPGFGGRRFTTLLRAYNNLRLVSDSATPYRYSPDQGADKAKHHT